MMKRAGMVLVVFVLASTVYWRMVRPQPEQRALSANLQVFPDTSATGGEFARAIGPYRWVFPRDHGAHPEYQTEWWYYTGNLQTNDGRRFGYQFTVFRRAITPVVLESPSEWRTNQMFMAHLTITDVTADAFYQFQRLSRGGAGLAGATANPRYRVWLEDWQVKALDADATHMYLSARDGNVALDLTLEQIKPPALQGEDGLSPKSNAVGNASYYYSLSRLLTRGRITIGDKTYQVEGTTWMDHEFGTSALGSNAQGWDWFGLHLDDGRDLMLGRIRLQGGGYEPVFGGLLVERDGKTRRISAEEFSIEVLDTWRSPHSGAVYPARWLIAVALGEETLTFQLIPLVADQELVEGAIIYWEGAVQITGDVTGYGYAELTGYFSPMQGRF